MFYTQLAMNPIYSDTTKDRPTRTEKEERMHNSTYPKGGVSCSKYSFSVNGSLVFQFKICGKSPALRLAAKRYGQGGESVFD